MSGNDSLESFERQAIALMELVTVLESGDVGISEKVRKAYAFAGMTATAIAGLGGGIEADGRIGELETALADATALLEERETACKAAADREKEQAERVFRLEVDLRSLEAEHAAAIRELEEIPTDVVTAHKRLAEGLKKYGDGDYEAALKNLIIAEKTLKKFDGRTFDYE